MSNYDSDKALDRLAWRFTSKKSFTPNENDIDSLNTIIGWMNRQQSESVKNNQLFAKLYIYFLNQTIRYFEANIFDDIPQKELSKLLDLPLDNYYNAFHKELQNNNINRVVENKNINKDDLLKEMQEKYTLEECTIKLDTMINEALNRFS
jgi:hypothetical protein